MFSSFLDSLVTSSNRNLIESIRDGYGLIFEGVHFGDKGVGSDTYLGRMHAGDGDRGTGHFGTGTYFLSDSNSSSHLRSTRPSHTIDTSGYGLLKVNSAASASDLHRGMKLLNSAVDACIRGDDEVVLGLLDSGIGLISKVVSKANHYGANQLLGMAHQKAAIYNSEGIGSKHSTLATDFIKMLGYNGIDVTSVPEYDNSMYGSVVYDM